MQKYLYLIVIAIYLWLTFNFWRKANGANQTLHTILLGVGLALHAWLLQNTLFYYAINLSVSNALSAVLWLTILIYWLATLFKQNLQALQIFVLPVAALCVLVQGLVRDAHFLDYANLPYFKAHVVVALLAYGLFTFAAFHALLMRLAERKLHHQSTWINLPDLPPLLPMEKLLFQAITAGFILLTLTVMSGFLFSEEIFGRPMQFNHKNIFAIISWLIYGTLLLGHYQLGWRGRKATRLALAGFASLLLAYMGSKFVLEILLK